VAPNGGSPDELYGDVDRRAERQVTLDSLTAGNAARHAGDGVLLGNIANSLVGHPEPADTNMLKMFARFRSLDHEKLELLAKQCLVYKVPPGTQLLERGTSDTWNLYLVDGSVQLTAADGGSKNIEAGTPTASNPISCLKPRMYTVSALTRVAFLWIDDKLIDEIAKSKAAPQRFGGAA
jgi:hypothetical protein